MKNYYTTLSEEILSLAKSGKDTVTLRRQLFYIRQAKLEKSLNTDDLKKTFWINIYNAFYLINLKETKQGKEIFNLKRIKIARAIFSLNDIEHGILRKYKFRIGFGYITNPFYSDFIKTLAVNKVDYRIHFALRSINLEKKTIDYFDCEEIEKQLTIVTKDFIRLETEFDNESKTIRASDFLLSYLRDFGGKKSVKKLLETVFERDLNEYKLRFKTYKRTEKLQRVS
ncbi:MULTISPECIES: DUF547 domain-containing protein [unclassified Flavobacterium]|uniref:DUF547 domain-containing protein n=1 Tax=unclassified Flavobacterium TaxID=196869 RepID=UPI000F219CD0|nr:MULTISPECIES: DUF547 domain-containing protein [unclassified Flavobacterium]MDI6050425.1 DUF547 domain-containing protein [Flavobacterium sp. XS2P24]RKS13618.1 uncharacterized protein DUF547 [Flavobacterium sp. 120]WKL44769.1 DUF547 domain-containing protein [Flavobacterium sp. ZE23DGlu08]